MVHVGVPNECITRESNQVQHVPYCASRPDQTVDDNMSVCKAAQHIPRNLYKVATYSCHCAWKRQQGVRQFACVMFSNRNQGGTARQLNNYCKVWLICSARRVTAKSTNTHLKGQLTYSACRPSPPAQDLSCVGASLCTAHRRHGFHSHKQLLL